MINKLEIKTQLEELLNAEDFNSVKNELKSISSDFLTALKKEEDELAKAKEDSEIEIETDVENTKLNEEIKSLISTYKATQKELIEARKQEEANNLKLKQDLLKSFQELNTSEEHIGKAFSSIKEIREQWATIGNIPRDNYQDIQNEYSRLNDEFSYNISIYKELQENDLKRNFSLKNQVIFELEKLKDVKNMREVELTYRKLQNDWNEIGGTYKEKWEELKEKYWNNIKKTSERLKAHYETKKLEREVNYTKKEALLEEFKILLKTNPSSHKEWENTTNFVLEFQKSWRNIGSIPKEKGTAIWDEFRALNDLFFEQKAAFYKIRNEEFKTNSKLKEALIEKAIKLKESSDINFATKQIITIQNDWKKIGHAGKFAEQKLWKQLREASDAIFNSKKEAANKSKEIENSNLEAKNNVISKIETIKLSKDPKEALSELKVLSDEFNAIGNVPFKMKDSIYKTYKSTLDKQYKSLGLSPDEQEKILFEIRLGSNDSDILDTLKKERKHTYDSIAKLEEEIKQLENNMGFFNISKSAEGLFKGVEENIQTIKQKIDTLKKRLVLIKEKENSL